MNDSDASIHNLNGKCGNINDMKKLFIDIVQFHEKF